MTAQQLILENRKERLEIRYTQISKRWKTHNRKLEVLQTDLVKEAGTAVRFQLQEEIEIEQKHLAELDNQMIDLENDLKRTLYEIEKDTENSNETISSNGAMAISDDDLPKLRANLIKYFSKSELLTICFDLSIDYESELDLSTKQTMVRTLLAYLKRRQQLPELLSIVRYQRPAVNWS